MSGILEKRLVTAAIDNPAFAAMLNIQLAAGYFNESKDQICAAHGITRSQYNVLRILRGAGADGVPTLDVASRMIEQAPGITRLLDRLESKEFVRRQRCPKDRRQHLCWITPKGLAVLAKLDAPTLRAHEESMKKLKARDREAFIRLLDAVRAAHG